MGVAEDGGGEGRPRVYGSIRDERSLRLGLSADRGGDLEVLDEDGVCLDGFWVRNSFIWQLLNMGLFVEWRGLYFKSAAVYQEVQWLYTERNTASRPKKFAILLDFRRGAVMLAGNRCESRVRLHSHSHSICFSCNNYYKLVILELIEKNKSRRDRQSQFRVEAIKVYLN